MTWVIRIKVKVSLVSYKLDKLGGGSNISLDLLARTLVNKNHEVKVITLSSNDNHLYKNRNYDVVEHSDSIGLPFDIEAVNSIKNLILEYSDDTDIFHIFNPYLASFSGYQKNNLNVDTPIVGRFNTIWTVCSRGSPIDNECYKNCNTFKRIVHSRKDGVSKVADLPLYYFMGNKNIKWLNNLDRIFALSPSVEDILTNMGVKSNNVVQIPNFYDPTLSMNEPAERVSDNGLELLFVGRLVETKRVDVLVDALCRIDDENIQLTIIGDGPTKDDLKKKADRNGKNNIQFKGYVENQMLPQYYARADVFVHPFPSPYNFSRTLVEALQWELPSIVPQNTDAETIMGNSIMSFEKNNPEHLAETILSLRTNSQKLYELRSETEEILQQFDPNDVVERMIREYEKLI